MDAILSPEQEELLKRTRNTLGDLRDMLAETTAVHLDRAALADSIRQLDDLFLLVVAGEFNSGKSAFINALLGKKLQVEGVTPKLVNIAATQSGDMIVIEVKDTGPGLPDEARARLFEPFQGSLKPGGSGLGVAIAYEIMRAHGGELELKSSNPGGAVFALFLPAS